MDRMIRATSYGEVGIDTEASPGNGAYYAKHYESGFDMCGFETINEGERAGRWAMMYLYMALFAVWFNIACIVGWHIKEWFL